MKNITSKKLAQLCAAGAADKKALEILVLDVRKLSNFTDFFVICSGESEPQLKAVCNSIRSLVFEETEQKPFGQDGNTGSSWMVLDFSDVMVHVFHERLREVYQLEHLWSDAPRVKVSLDIDVAKADLSKPDVEAEVKPATKPKAKAKPKAEPEQKAAPKAKAKAKPKAKSKE